MKETTKLCIYCEENMSGMMICCDRCDCWYHIRVANPSLKIRYTSPDNFTCERQNHEQFLDDSSTQSSSYSHDSSSSSSPASLRIDEAIENKLPKRPKSLKSAAMVKPASHIATPKNHYHHHQNGQQNHQQTHQQHQHQQQIQATPQQQKHRSHPNMLLEPSVSVTSGKPKKAHRSSRDKLRSKLKKAMKRQRHQSQI